MLWCGVPWYLCTYIYCLDVSGYCMNKKIGELEQELIELKQMHYDLKRDVAILSMNE